PAAPRSGPTAPSGFRGRTPASQCPEPRVPEGRQCVRVSGVVPLVGQLVLPLVGEPALLQPGCALLDEPGMQIAGMSAVGCPIPVCRVERDPCLARPVPDGQPGG